jgi:hypothetical protein
MSAQEFLVVDVGSESVKLGGTLTILAVGASFEEAREKAKSVNPRSVYVAILERKEFHRRKPVIEFEQLPGSLVKTDPPKEDPK